MQCLLILKLILLSPLVLAHRITFPPDDEFQNGCRLPDGGIGSCTKYNECFILHTQENQVTTCYFEKFEHYICCAENLKIPTEKVPVISTSFLPSSSSPLVQGVNTRNPFLNSIQNSVTTGKNPFLTNIKKPNITINPTLPSYLQLTYINSTKNSVITEKNPFLTNIKKRNITTTPTLTSFLQLTNIIPTTTTSNGLPAFLQLTKKPISGLPQTNFAVLEPVQTSTTTTPPISPTNEKKLRLPKPCTGPTEFRITVVMGLKTQPQEFPYMIALGWQTFEENVYDYRCGGALIAEDFIVSAAHCAYSHGLPPIVALPGGVHLNDTSQKLYKIKQVIEHPDYVPELTYNDIALIELEEPIREKNVKPLCIWNSDPLLLNKENVTAIGYGHTRFAGSSSNELLKAYLKVVDNEECKKFYDSIDALPQGIIDTQMCAKDPDNLRDTCQGDSGGPLVMSAGLNKNYIVGVTSFGQACAKEPPGVYTRVASYNNWIDSIVWPK